MVKTRNKFTLIEMIIAMGIMLLVGVIIGTASSILYNGYRRINLASNRINSYIAIDRVMDGCVRNIVPFTWIDDDDSSDKLVFEGEVDSVHFTTMRRSYGNDQGPFLFIKLSFDRNEEALVAEFSSLPFLPFVDTEDQVVTREVLSTNVKNVTFYYVESLEDDFTYEESWLEEDDYDYLPKAIQMNVEWKDGRSEQWLRRVAGASAFSTYGVVEDSSNEVQ